MVWAVSAALGNSWASSCNILARIIVPCTSRERFCALCSQLSHPGVSEVPHWEQRPAEWRSEVLKVAAENSLPSFVLFCWHPSLLATCGSFEVQEAIYIVPFKMRDGKSIGGRPLASAKHAWRNELQPEIRG